MSDKVSTIIVIVAEIVSRLIQWTAEMAQMPTSEVRQRVLAELAKPAHDATDKVAPDLEAAIKKATGL